MILILIHFRDRLCKYVLRHTHSECPYLCSRGNACIVRMPMYECTHMRMHQKCQHDFGYTRFDGLILANVCNKTGMCVCARVCICVWLVTLVRVSQIQYACMRVCAH